MGVENRGQAGPQEPKHWKVVRDNDTGMQHVSVNIRGTFTLGQRGMPVGEPQLVVAEGDVVVDGLITLHDLMEEIVEAFDRLPAKAVQEVDLTGPPPQVIGDSVIQAT